MVEDMNKWGPVEKTVAQAIHDHEAASKEGSRGLSLPGRITAMLRDKDLLNKDLFK